MKPSVGKIPPDICRSRAGRDKSAGDMSKGVGVQQCSPISDRDSRRVPTCFFVLCGPDGERHDDKYGTQLAQKSDAVGNGRRIVRERADAGGYDEPAWYLEIIDDGGQPIATLPFPKTLN